VTDDVTDGVTVVDGDTAGVDEGVTDKVTDGVVEGVTDGVIDGDAPNVGVIDGVTDKVTDGVTLGVLDGVTDGVIDGDAPIVGVIDGVGVGLTIPLPSQQSSKLILNICSQHPSQSILTYISVSIGLIPVISHTSPVVIPVQEVVPVILVDVNPV
jgi:hypothetical protein